jgi:hypothetical protein
MRARRFFAGAPSLARLLAKVGRLLRCAPRLVAGSAQCGLRRAGDLADRAPAASPGQIRVFRQRLRQPAERARRDMRGGDPAQRQPRDAAEAEREAAVSGARDAPDGRRERQRQAERKEVSMAEADVTFPLLAEAP